MSTQALISLLNKNFKNIIEELQFNSVVEITNESLITIL